MRICYKCKCLVQSISRTHRYLKNTLIKHGSEAAVQDRREFGGRGRGLSQKEVN